MGQAIGRRSKLDLSEGQRTGKKKQKKADKGKLNGFHVIGINGYSKNHA